MGYRNRQARRNAEAAGMSPVAIATASERTAETLIRSNNSRRYFGANSRDPKQQMALAKYGFHTPIGEKAEARIRQGIKKQAGYNSTTNASVARTSNASVGKQVTQKRRGAAVIVMASHQATATSNLLKKAGM
jgi:hypothetical protein